MSNQVLATALGLNGSSQSYKPYIYEAMPRNDVRVAQAMLDGPRVGFLSVGAQAYKIIPIAPRAQKSQVRCIQLKVGGANVAIELPLLICNAWLDERFDASIPEGLLPPIVSMMFEQAMAPLVEFFEAATRMPIEFRQIVEAESFAQEFLKTRKNPEPQTHMALHFAVFSRGNPQPMLLRMICPESWLEMMAACTPLQEVEISPRLNGLAVDVAVVAAIARINAHELQHMGAGDVILADHSLLSQNLVGLVGGNRRLIARLTANELCIEEGVYPAMSEINNSNMSDTQNVPVDVQFRLGSLQMTVGQLSEIVQGQIIQLGKPINAPVELCVNGSIVGSGQLVEVEGQVAVRVTQTKR